MPSKTQAFRQLSEIWVEVIDRNKEEAQKKSKHSKLKENEGTLANCEFEPVNKSPQHHRHESEESLLDAC